MDDWPGEKWLDIRNLAVLKPIMTKRARAAKARGFDGIDWDNVDGYNQDDGTTGWPLTYAHQIAYNKMLAQITHDLGMVVGLKNDLDQLEDLVGHFDFAVNEQAQAYKEQERLQVFIKIGKPVVDLEYAWGAKKVCQVAKSTSPRVYVLYKDDMLGAGGFDCQKNRAIKTN